MKAQAVIPPIKTLVSVSAQAPGVTAYAQEGHAFSPMFTLGLRGKLSKGEELTTWLNLERAD